MEVIGHAIDQFDVSSASTVFWETVPVLLQRAEREDSVDQLSVRLLSGNTRNSLNMKVLRMHIFNDDDLLFLHTLEVSEEDFQTLKAEQGILVDFANFSGKIIDLLRRCIDSKDEEVPRFRAVLNMSHGESVFKMVETNDFKQLPHISLCFRPGTDMAIKSFLAFRLTEVQQEAESLQKDLACCRDALSKSNQDCTEKAEQLSEAEAARSKLAREAEASAKDAASKALEERMQEKAQLVSSFERTKRELQEEHETAIKTLNARLAERDKENRELRDAKYTQDAKVSELTHKLNSSEGQVASLTQEVKRLQDSSQSLAREKSANDVSLADARAQLASLREKAAMQEKVIDQQQERIQDLEQSSKQLDSRCAELREAANGHEHRGKEAAAQVTKCNGIIERLTADLQSSKDKLKRKQVIIVRQEEELQDRERSSDTAAREHHELQRAHTTLQDEHARLQSANEELRSKLEDSKQQLQGNEQMIRWLNSQVNEAQLAASRPPPASTKYTFKPSMASSAADSPPASTAYSRPHGHVPGTTASQPRLLAGSSTVPTPVPFQPLSNTPHSARDSVRKFGVSGKAASPGSGITPFLPFSTPSAGAL